MTRDMYAPENFPDEYLSDLDEEFAEDIKDDVSEEQAELAAQMQFIGFAIVCADLFEGEYITLREYVEWTNAMEDMANERGIRLP